ncbi:MAG: hypothetical protein ACYCQI_14380 [Gammaproteobacteria bacterium]
MDTRLRDGDILIEMEDDSSIKVIDKKKEEILSLTVETQSSSHGSIYYKDKEYHSVEGTKYSGVMKQDILKPFPLQQSKAKYKMEGRIILRCKDKELGRLVGETAARWAVTLSQDELKARPQRHNTTQLFVPLSSWDERVEDSKDRAALHELYRAFRAYMRNHATPVVSLSKKKGVSCSQYISYSLKSAIIERLFSKEQIDKLIQKVKEIESLKYRRVQEGKGEQKQIERISKLSQIDIKHFEDFNQLFLACQKSIDIENREKYFAYLVTPVKSKNIDKLVARIADNPEIFEFAGYFCVIKGDKPRAGVVDHDSYLRLVQPEEKEKRPKPHDVFIHESELTRISTITTSSESAAEMKYKA